MVESKSLSFEVGFFNEILHENSYCTSYEIGV